ncbi:hypothetical protein MBANPS3_003290 [Mucor bainieri]
MTHLARIDLTSVPITEKSASRIIYYIPRVSRFHNVVIFVKGVDADCFKTVASYMKEKGVVLEKKRMLEADEEDREELSSSSSSSSNLVGIRKKRLRTPSPCRADIDSLREKIVDIKQRFGHIHHDPKTIVPRAIKSRAARGRYVDIQELVQSDLQHDELTHMNFADAAVNTLAPQFLENIAISSKGSYLFITEIEVYLRASPTIDDCANNTVTVGCPTVPLFVIEQKREFRNQWLEAKTYCGKFEFLVTSCVHGKVDNDNVRAVLGATLSKPDLPGARNWFFSILHDQGFASASAINIHGDHFAAAGSQ